jgi:hypothetical protein
MIFRLLDRLGDILEHPAQGMRKRLDHDVSRCSANLQKRGPTRMMKKLMQLAV